jgi:hypothetical protein
MIRGKFAIATPATVLAKEKATTAKPLTLLRSMNPLNITPDTIRAAPTPISMMMFPSLPPRQQD